MPGGEKIARDCGQGKTQTVSVLRVNGFRGGNLNKEAISNDLGSKDTYMDIKEKYGNHASKFNILTGR